VGVAEVRRRHAILPSVLVGSVPLLITVAAYVAGLVPGQIGQYLAALPVGCAGLAGCTAALCWLRRGGRGWPGALGCLGGCGELAGAGLFVTAGTGLGSTNDGWDALGYLLLGFLCSVVGCALMLIGAIAMIVSLRRSATVRSAAACPAGGW
ncbi:MAG TPA: hypothetical protein VFU36_01630, partial [Jatrophihabitans sp.]|nr:hypothetical protein [Jatrophihabitans sp.]